MENEVTEDDCVVCSKWPKADRETNRLAAKDLPTEGACILCRQASFLEFWRAITVVCDSKEELDAWVEAVRLERRKPQASRRHGHEILEEIRSKAASKH
jgi:hypothetical protein